MPILLLLLMAGYPSMSKRAQIHMGMEDVEVRALLGEPDSMDGGMCGDPLTKAKRACLTWRYGGGGHEFSVELQYNHGSYFVAQWKDR